MKEYLIHVGDALSQLLNVMVFLSDNPNESLSGRCYRQKDHWWFGRLRRTIDAVAHLMGDVGHCANAHRYDIRRAQDLIQANKR